MFESIHSSWQFVISAALVAWLMIALVPLARFLGRQFGRMSVRAKTSPFSFVFAVAVVGMTVAAVGTKPAPVVVEPVFTHTSQGDNYVLTGVSNTPTSKNLVIPSKIDGHSVVGIAANFCSGNTYFTGVSIPASVTSIGSGFFGYSSKKPLTSVSVAKGNTAYGVTSDKVLYAKSNGSVVYAAGSVTTVRFKLDFNRCTHAEGEEKTYYKNFGADFTIPGVLFTRTPPRVQSGWTTDPTAKTNWVETIEYAFGDVYSDNADRVFYPAWTQLDKIVLTFSANGGSGSMADIVSEEKDVYISLPKCGFTAPAGRVFKNWIIGSTEYSPGGSKWFSTFGSYVVKANWAYNSSVYGVDFYDGDKLVGSMGCVRNRVYSLPKISTLVPGKKGFKGWKCRIGGKDRRYDDGVSFFNLADLGASVTMTAIW